MLDREQSCSESSGSCRSQLRAGPGQGLPPQPGYPGPDSPAGQHARRGRAGNGSQPGAGRGCGSRQGACAAGLAYAAVSLYWAAGGTWLLSTVAGTLGQPGHAGDPGLTAVAWAAAVLKLTAAVVPLAAAGAAPGQAAGARRRQIRVLAWAEAAILTAYGLVLAGAGLLVQSGAITPAAGADHRALAWHACLWGPWFLL